MIDLKAIDDLARRLTSLVPPGLKDARSDLEQNMKATLQAGLAKLDLGPEKQRAAMAELRGIYGSFTEGFDAGDLVEARSVLDGSRISAKS